MGEVFEVILIGFQGKRHVIDVASSRERFDKTIVAKLKKLVADKLNKAEKVGSLQPEDIKLVFATKSLEDHYTLQFYNIIPKSSIVMIYGLKGGWC